MTSGAVTTSQAQASVTTSAVTTNAVTSGTQVTTQSVTTAPAATTSEITSGPQAVITGNEDIDSGTGSGRIMGMPKLTFYAAVGGGICGQLITVDRRRWTPVARSGYRCCCGCQEKTKEFFN